jgi:xanthine dehydrogenase molybdopterin-binding subunit B
MPGVPEWIAAFSGLSVVLVAVIGALIHLYARIAVLEDHDKTVWGGLLKRGVAQIVWKGLGTLRDDDD